MNGYCEEASLSFQWLAKKKVGRKVRNEPWILLKTQDIRIHRVLQ